MRAALGIASVLAGLAACEELTVVAYDADDGVLPMWYEDTLVGLPVSYEFTEWPDGATLLETATGNVLLFVDTRPDGGRDVTITRSVWLLDAPTSAYLRDWFGVDAIESIRGVDLALMELRIDDVDPAAGAPELRAGGSLIPADGSPAPLSGTLVERLRSQLLAGDEIRVPVSLTFHLPADGLDALPPRRLRLFIMVQPTLWVDVLGAL